MAGTSGKTVTLRHPDEDIVNANSPRQAAKSFITRDDDADIKSEDDDDFRNKNSNSLEMSSVGNAGSRTNVPGPSNSAGNAAALPGSKDKADKEKKVGHRRVTTGGDVTYKKIQTSQIMGSIQLGVQHAIGGLASKPERDLLIPDFFTVEQTNFPSGGSNQTPAHHYSDFRFKTYAPMAFRHFRELFGIQTDDFLMSLCSTPLRELSNPGASGSIFYLTSDDEFIIKTVQHKECEFLQKLLPGYYMNLDQNPRTLLPKFFGLFTYQCNSKNVRLCVMNNLLPSWVKMHQKYDLKGSTYKRKANKAEREKAYPTFKDLDFLEHHPDGISLEQDTCASLLKTLHRDCRVLESFKIMDYSLLVGIHNLDIAAKEKAERKLRKVDSDDEEEGEYTGKGLSRSKSINRQKLVAHSTALESIQAESEPIDADDDVPPGGIPARNSKGERLLLYLGIIDILQSYRLKKKLEHTFKAMIHDGDTVSVHRPGFYAERFMNFMTKSVFRKIPSLDLPEIKGNHRKFRNLVSTYLALKHSPSKKRGPPMRLRGPGDIGDAGDSSIGSPSKVTSPMSCASMIMQSPPRQKSPPGQEPAGFPIGQYDYGNGAKRMSAGLAAKDKDKSSGGNAVGDVSGGGGASTAEGSVSMVSSPPSSLGGGGAMFPSVLNKEARPASMNRGKIPPPVPPRTPKRSVFEGSSETPLPVSTPPPPFQEKVVQGLQGSGRGSHYGQGTEQSRDNWNLTQSQSPTRRVISGSSASTSSSLEHPTRRSHVQVGITRITDSETVSVSEVYVETRMHQSSLSVASSSTTSGVSSSLGHRMPRSPPTGVHDFSRNTSATPTWTEGTPSYTESSSSGDLGEDYLGPSTPAKGTAQGGRREDTFKGAEDKENDNEHEMTRL